MKPAIAYCIDAAYALPLAVSLRSVLENWRGDRAPDVYVLESSLGEAEREKVRRSLPTLDGASLTWITVDPAEVADLAAGLHFSSANYFRLLLPRLLANTEVVLYLDADTVALDDVSPLFFRHDPRVPLHACQDYLGTISNPLINLPMFARFGMVADDPYFNSGVLLMNLRAWREERVAEMVMELGRSHPEATFLADQTLINLSLRGRISRLPPAWNIQTIHPNVTSGVWNVPFVPQPLEGAKLLHYTTEFKPWGVGRNLSHARAFASVKSRTLWADA